VREKSHRGERSKHTAERLHLLFVPLGSFSVVILEVSAEWIEKFSETRLNRLASWEVRGASDVV
jgi:hypothetical protein